MDAFSLGLYMHLCVKDLAILLVKAREVVSHDQKGKLYPNSEGEVVSPISLNGLVIGA